jgi:F-type H+-transporting ATPase subunit gamma
MLRIKEIEQRMSDVKLLQELTSTFESIAAQNLSATRQKVLDAREFLEDARRVYFESRLIYAQQHKLKNLSEYHEQLSVRASNGKSLAVIVAPNTKLYGALPDQLLNSSVAQIREHPSDVLILGKVGVEFFNRLKPPIPFVSLPVDDEDLSVQQIHDVVAFMSRYHKVTAYYNHFRTVLTADVLAAELTLTPPEAASPYATTGVGEKHSAIKNDAWFEPSLEEVLNFFESIILKTLLQQKVHESLLSRYAARMVAMDVATENAKTAGKKLLQEMRRAKRQKQNAKMLDNYSGMVLWKS